MGFNESKAMESAAIDMEGLKPIGVDSETVMADASMDVQAEIMDTNPKPPI